MLNSCVIIMRITKPLFYLCLLLHVSSCATQKNRVVFPDRSGINISLKPSYEYLDVKSYPELTLKGNKIKNITIYLHFQYDSTFTYFSWWDQKMRDSIKSVKKEKSLYFSRRRFVTFWPDDNVFFRISGIKSYCDYFYQKGYYNKRRKQWTKWRHIHIPGWIKCSLKNNNHIKAEHGKTIPALIDTIKIQSIYVNLEVPIDTSNTTTEKIPLPF